MPPEVARRQPDEAFMRLKVEEIVDGGVFVRFSTEEGDEFWAGTPPPDPPLTRLTQMMEEGVRDNVWVRFDSDRVRIVDDKGDSTPSLFDQLEGGVISIYRFRGRVGKILRKDQIPKDGRWVHSIVLHGPDFDIHSNLISEEELPLEAGTMIEADGEILAAIIKEH